MTMKETVKKIWLYLLVGKVSFFYLVLFFPNRDKIIFNEIILDLFKSTLLAFSTFIGLFLLIYLHEIMQKK